MHRPSCAKQGFLYSKAHFDQHENLFVPRVPGRQAGITIDEYNINKIEGPATGLIDVAAIRVQQIALDLLRAVCHVKFVLCVLAVPVL